MIAYQKNGAQRKKVSNFAFLPAIALWSQGLGTASLCRQKRESVPTRVCIATYPIGYGHAIDYDLRLTTGILYTKTIAHILQ